MRLAAGLLGLLLGLLFLLTACGDSTGPPRFCTRPPCDTRVDEHTCRCGG